MTVEDPILFSLTRLRYDVFGTLTFSGKVPRPAKAKSLVFQFFRASAQDCGTPYSDLLIVLREERGELRGRYHLHFLLGGCRVNNLHTLAFQMSSRWRQIAGGFAKIRAYDQSRRGLAYTLKGLDLDAEAANRYELEKFSSADRLTVSRSCARVLRSFRRMRDTGRHAPTEKRPADDAGTLPGRH